REQEQRAALQEAKSATSGKEEAEVAGGNKSSGGSSDENAWQVVQPRAPLPRTASQQAAAARRH
ncbi:unnamed protein product, partial [Amoebophrya sp. A25]